MATPTDYYSRLGVSPDADTGQIKRAFRAKAKEHHPDHNDGSEQAAGRFRAINEAYEVLRDPVKRQRYDRMVHGRPVVEYGRPGPSTTWEPNPAVRTVEVRDVDLERSGGHLRFRVPVECDCVLCGGLGTVGTERTCTSCRGEGMIEVSSHEARSSTYEQERCEPCGGEGRLPPRSCPVCKGRGAQVHEEAVTVEVGPLRAGSYTLTVTPPGAESPVTVDLVVVATRRQSPYADRTARSGRTWTA